MRHDRFTPQCPDELRVTLDGRPALVAVDHVAGDSLVCTVREGPGRGRVVVVPRPDGCRRPTGAAGPPGRGTGSGTPTAG